MPSKASSIAQAHLHVKAHTLAHKGKHRCLALRYMYIHESSVTLSSVIDPKSRGTTCTNSGKPITVKVNQAHVHVYTAASLVTDVLTLTAGMHQRVNEPAY